MLNIRNYFRKMPEYICKKCNKIFDKRDSYKKHLKRKIPCNFNENKNDIKDLKNEIENLKNIINSKVNNKMSQVIADRSNEDMIINVIKECHNIMYSEEAIVGEKAMHDLMRLLFLRFLEPLIDSGKIDIMDPKYYEKDPDWGTDFNNNDLELLKWSVFKEKSGTIEQLEKNINMLWKYILINYDNTKMLFVNDTLNCKINTVSKLIEEINKCDTNFENINIDIFGELYEMFINAYAKKGDKLGQFFTNRNYINVIFSLLNFTMKEDKEYSMIDPCSGTGGFIMEAKKHFKNITLYANEIEKSTFSYLYTNMILNGHSDFNNFNRVNSLHHLEPKTKFDLILTNPPFGTKIQYKDILENYRSTYCEKLTTKYNNKKLTEKEYNKLTESKFRKIFPYKANKGELLFLQLCAYKLEKGGKCAIVLPDGQMLFGGGANKNVRKYLLDNFIFEKILFAPSGAFEHTGVKTCVYFFRKPTDEERVKVKKGKPLTDKLEFWQMTADCKDWGLLGELTYEQMSKDNFSFSYDKYMNKLEMEKQYQKSEYEYKTLGEVCEIKMGERIRKKDNINKSKYPVYGGGYEAFRTDSFNRNGKTCKIGRFGISRHNCVLIMDKKYYLNDSGFTINSKEKLLMDEYLWYYIYQIKSDIYNLSNGSAQKNLDMSLFKSIKIPIPPLEIQQEIVNECNEVYQMIEQTKNQITTIEKGIEKYKKYILPKELGEVVEYKTLGEVCEKIKGEKINSKTGIKTGKYPLYYCSILGHLYLDNYTYEGDGIIINKTNGSGKCAIYYTNGKYNVGKSTLHFKAINNIMTEYVYYSLLNIKDNIESLYVGVNQRSLSMDDLFSLKIPVPSLEIQQGIVKKYSFHHNSIKNLKNMISDYENIKNQVIDRYV